MRTTAWARGVLVSAVAGLVLCAAPARAEIVGLLETPEGYASGTSNVQGWVYTNTPGATLQQPFSVRVNGVEVMKIPCCGDRGDVMDLHPDAPLQTGFSGVYNWGLAATAAAAAADSTQGLAPEITVEVVVTDDMGGSKTLSNTVFLFHPTTFPRSKLMQWQEPVLVPLAHTFGGILIPFPEVDAECTLSNSGFFDPDAAELICTNMVHTAADDSTETCTSAVFSWDKASQSFKLTGNCGPSD